MDLSKTKESNEQGRQFLNILLWEELDKKNTKARNWAQLQMLLNN